MMNLRHTVLFFVFAFGSLATAAELRIWTSVSGTTIEAKFKKIDGDKVVLITPKPKEISVKIADLSLADRSHLVEYAEADKKILTDVKLAKPEKDAKIDRSTFKKHEKKMGFGDDTLVSFDVFETEHFLIASAGRFRPQAVAETAERLWHGMAFQHMNFRQDWGDKKKVIIVTNDEEIYAGLGKWYVDWIRDNGTDEEKAEGEATRMESLWPRVSGTSLALPEEQQQNYNAFPRASVLRIRDGSDQLYKKVLNPFPTHSIAGMLLSHQMGGVSDISPLGYFALTTGHAYFKEIQLAGKSVTSMIDADDYGDDEISSASGFKEGRSWAKTLRKLVRKGKVTPSLEKLLALTSATDLDPEKLVLIYSLSYYMQSDSTRLANFAKMVRRIESSNQVPALIEIAKIFGFETVEAFQADWINFIKSTKFK